MIKFNLDGSGKYEVPELVLCNPNRGGIGFIGHHKNLVYRPKLRDLSELSFEIYSHYKVDEKMVKDPVFDLIVKNRLISICSDYEDENSPVEWFIIYTANREFINNTTAKKTVTCYSYERSLGKRNADFLDGTYKLYDYINPTDTLLQKVITEAPAWKVGTVDAVLLNKWRTFEDISDSLYNFLRNECEEAYDCLFVFDNDNLTINAYDRQTFVQNTNIVFSHSSLIKALNVDDDIDDVVTALNVIGGGDVDIRAVNPTGDNYIYNYSYYKTTEWIDQALIDAITAWENKINSNRVNFSNNLSNIKTYQEQLLTLETQLTDLENELKAIELVRSAQIATTVGVQAETTNSYNSKLTQINSKKNEIAVKESQITTATNANIAINNQLKKNANFTVAQLKLLDEITFQGEYSNPNFIVTDIMTNAEKQTVAEELYARGIDELNLLSVPNFSFEMDTVNFLFLEKFKSFTDEIRLGRSVNVEMQEDLWAYPILIEMEIDYETPTNFKMIFGTKLNMRSDLTNISEAIKDASNVNTKVSSNAPTWDIPVKSGLVDEVTQYMNNNLDLSLQQIQSSASQNVMIGDYGIRVRKLLSGSTYDPRQLWINDGTIAMTDNNWQSSKLAIGIFNGVSSVNADVLAGRILAGNALTITNEQGSFRLDGNKITVTNMDMTLTNGVNTITLNPTTGLRFRRQGNTILDLDISNGNATFNGNGSFNGSITANSGSIGSWNISPTGISNGTIGDRIMSDGTGKLGLLTWDRTGATFAGTITANSGSIGGWRISPNGLENDATGDRIMSNGSGQLSLLSWGITNGVKWAKFDGEISATVGRIGGWTVNSYGLYNSANGDYIYSNGTGKLSLLSWTPNSANFSGTVYAPNIDTSRGALASWQYGSGSVISSALGDKAVINSKIGNGAVNTLQIAYLAVTGAEIANATIGTAKIIRGEFDDLYATRASIGTLLANYISANHLNASQGITTPSIIAGGGNFSIQSDGATRLQWVGNPGYWAGNFRSNNGYSGSFTVGGRTFNVSGGIILDN